MTKPWEETWTAETDGYVDCGGRVVARAQVRGASDGVAAPLIAQAPAMARLLLDLQWSGTDEDGSKCPSCYATAYGDKVHDAAGNYLHCEEGTHETDCPLVAVLRAAGVVP